MKSKSSRRLFFNALALVVMLSALAIAPAAQASGPCQSAGCTGWQCVEFQYRQCTELQDCCACTCGAYSCQYIQPLRIA
jgi:hypothetical protein